MTLEVHGVADDTKGRVVTLRETSTGHVHISTYSSQGDCVTAEDALYLASKLARLARRCMARNRKTT